MKEQIEKKDREIIDLKVCILLAQAFFPLPAPKDQSAASFIVEFYILTLAPHRTNTSAP